MNQTIDTIIFDLGGVLVDWNPVYLYKKVFNTDEKVTWFLENVCTSDWNVAQDGGRTIAEANAQKIKEYPEYKTEILMFYDRWEEMFSGSIEQMVEIQQYLIHQTNYKVVALTNWSAETWDRGVSLFPFFKDFDNVLVSGKESTRKPFDEIYKLALEKFEIKNPATAVFVDDNLNNVLAARKNGLHGIHYKSTSQYIEELQKLNVKIGL